MTAQHAETQTPDLSNCAVNLISSQSRTVDKYWFQAKLQPYSQQTVFVWNSILLFDDFLLSSAIFSTTISIFGLAAYFNTSPFSASAIVVGFMYLGKETKLFGLANIIKHRMEVAAVQPPRRDFDQICDILGSFVGELRSIKDSVALVRETRPALFGIMAAVSVLQAIAFGIVFSWYILALLMVSSMLLLPVAYEWGFPNQMNAGNRTVIDVLNGFFSQPAPCKGKWVKITDNADETEWEKDFSAVPETDGEIPVLIVPKSSNEEQKVDDPQKSNVDNLSNLIKKLTEDIVK
ncbi:hypothetical protein Unana1_07926 [Umbelopsis nana]